MIVGILLIFVVLLGIQRTSAYKNGSRVKRAAIFGIAVGTVVFIFNLIWPYGESPVFLPG